MTDQIEPSKLSYSQIAELAKLFANKIGYSPEKGNIRDCVKKYGGKIKYDSNKIDSIGGSITVNSRNDFVIYLSPYTGEQRDNFTIAHELGHYVLHSRLGEIKLNANRNVDNHDLAEREANCFAAEFLMPEDLIINEYNNYKDNLLLLAIKLNVSFSALKWRCRNLGLIK